MCYSKLTTPFSIFFFLLYLTSCERFRQNSEKTESNIIHDVKDVISFSYRDGGAVLPNPTVRNVNFVIQDSTNGKITYIEINGQDSTKENIDLNLEQIELVLDNIAQLADTPDGLEIKPGKVPCVGKHSVDVFLSFNNGDTTSFKIHGGALCDPDVAPEWKSLDSIAKLLHHNKMNKL